MLRPALAQPYATAQQPRHPTAGFALGIQAGILVGIFVVGGENAIQRHAG